LLWAVPDDERTRRAELRVVRGDLSEDGAALAALRRRDPAAVGALFDRHARRIERLLLSVLGPDPDLPDLVQQTFLGVLSSLPSFRGDAASLVSWLNRVCVFTARKHIRQRRARRWLRFGAPEELPELPASAAGPELRAAAARAYRLMDGMPTDERLAFGLRFIEQLELAEVAEAMELSLATVKRRLAAARARFVDRARHDPLLRPWLDEETDGT
jgi:RNA polymerase sigma-70 factor (ECF subfamily)